LESTFPSAFRHVLQFEGGYGRHRLDRGGPTNFGITQATLSHYRRKTVTARDVKSLTLAEAEAIYRQFYWHELDCDALPFGVDAAVFDAAVNHGAARASKMLAGSVSFAGISRSGGSLADAVGKAKPVVILNEFMALRMRAYGSLTHLFGVFGLGWSRRLMATHSLALTLIHQRTS
jgi:lysozyme family protein